MNKNVEKTMSRALSATLALGVVSAAIPVSAKTATSYYNDAKKAVATANSSKTQAAIDKANAAIKALKDKTKLDSKAPALQKQVDAAQKALYNKVKSAVSKFKDSQNKSDYDSAKKLIDTLNNSSSSAVKANGVNYQKSLDAARATIKSVAAIAAKTVDYATTADKLGLPTTVSVVLSNGETTNVNVNWDTTKYNPGIAGKYTIEGTVSVPNTKYYKGTDLKASVDVTVQEGPFQVQYVNAVNATQVKVLFSKELDKTDAQTVARYAINGTNPATATLESDKKTVTLTFASAEVTDGVLVVNPIKSADDATVTSDKYSKVFTYTDTVKPEIYTIEANTNGSIASSVKIKATEPISSAVAKIDGTYYTINFGGTDTATISGLSLSNSTAHTLELINLTDKATVANVTISTSKAFYVSTDTTAPTATLTAKTDKQILVTFDKSMDVNTVTAALALNTGVKDEAFASVNHAVAAVVADTDNKQFTIDVADTLYTNASSRTLTVVLPNTIKDSLGNSIATTTKQVTLTKDTVAPVATGYKLIKDSNGRVTDLEVSFSKELAANVNPAEPVIVDANGVVVTTTLLGGVTANAVVAGDKKITFHFTTAAKIAGTYGFSFPVDLATDRSESANKSVAFNYNVNFGTETGTFDLTSATALSNVITVNFGRAVKGGTVAGSATDLSNYTLGGKALPAGTIINLDSTQNTATITLGAEGIATTDANAIFTVSNVKSLTGEIVNNFTKTLSVTDNTSPILTSAVLNSNGSITLGYSETLNTATVVGDYTVKLNGKVINDAKVAALTAGSGSEAGKYIIPNFVASYDAGTGSAGDEVVYIDADNSGTYSASADILLQSGTIANLAASNYASGKVGANDTAITSITITTDASATGKDAANNVIKAGTTITIK